MKHFIIGKGEVGTALLNVLSEVDDFDVKTWDMKDDEKLPDENCKILHIAFPYSKNFNDHVLSYASLLEPEIVLIHSTVKLGTTKKLNKSFDEISVFHSPVRGRHNELEESLKTFTKYIGGRKESTDDEKYLEVIKALEKANIPVTFVHFSAATELGKILSTFQYSAHLEIADEMEKICHEFQVPYEIAVEAFNRTYNEGYSKMEEKREEERVFQRPILFPNIDDGFGGHCLAPNNELLADFMRENSVSLPDTLKRLEEIGQR